MLELNDETALFILKPAALHRLQDMYMIGARVNLIWVSEISDIRNPVMSNRGDS
jgi:hypothetical protein